MYPLLYSCERKFLSTSLFETDEMHRRPISLIFVKYLFQLDYSCPFIIDGEKIKIDVSRTNFLLFHFFLKLQHIII